MSGIEKAPSLEDYKIAELLEASMQDIQLQRESEILQKVEPGQGLNQGVEYFYNQAEKSANEIISARDLDKVSALTVLEGYVAARYLKNPDLDAVYGWALKRKGIDDLSLLERVIEVLEGKLKNVSAESILEIYRKGGDN